MKLISDNLENLELSTTEAPGSCGPKLMCFVRTRLLPQTLPPA